MKNKKILKMETHLCGAVKSETSIKYFVTEPRPFNFTSKETVEEIRNILLNDDIDSLEDFVKRNPELSIWHNYEGECETQDCKCRGHTYSTFFLLHSSVNMLKKAFEVGYLKDDDVYFLFELITEQLENDWNRTIYVLEKLNPVFVRETYFIDEDSVKHNIFDVFQSSPYLNDPLADVFYDKLIKII